MFESFQRHGIAKLSLVWCLQWGTSRLAKTCGASSDAERNRELAKIGVDQVRTCRILLQQYYWIQSEKVSEISKIISELVALVGTWHGNQTLVAIATFFFEISPTFVL